MFINVYSVYLARCMSNNKSPYIAWPFQLAEFALLFVLYTQDNGLDTTEKLQQVRGMVMEFVVRFNFTSVRN